MGAPGTSHATDWGEGDTGTPGCSSPLSTPIHCLWGCGCPPFRPRVGKAGGVGSARGRALRASNYPRSGWAPALAARSLRAPGPCLGRTPPVPVHLSPAALGSQPLPAASGCSSEPPSPFCTGGRSHGTNPHCPRARRRRRRRTPAPGFGVGRAGLRKPLWRPRWPEGGGGW